MMPHLSPMIWGLMFIMFYLLMIMLLSNLHLLINKKLMNTTKQYHNKTYLWWKWYSS
uniref:ATP8 CDS n=1 Tax=Olavius algarvensis TaxID=188229 RepID=A0A7R9RDP4_9ANNE|nr:ATP8 CDS [Olavius algarvensis]CAD7857581.1 ATP8 CDS [Olavius algarvensis]